MWDRTCDRTKWGTAVASTTAVQLTASDTSHMSYLQLLVSCWLGRQIQILSHRSRLTTCWSNVCNISKGNNGAECAGTAVYRHELFCTNWLSELRFESALKSLYFKMHRMRCSTPAASLRSLEESLSALLNVGNGVILLEHEKRNPVDTVTTSWRSCTVTTTWRSCDTHVRYDGESEFECLWGLRYLI